MNTLIKIKSALALFSLLFILSACASVDYSQQKVFPQVRNDQALVYFYRTPGFIGSTYRFKVSEGKQVVGAMAQDSYFYVFATPGKHTYVVDDRHAEQGSSITLDVKAGKTYYVRVDVQYELLGGKPVFTQVSEQEAKQLLPGRKYVLPAKTKPYTYNVYAQ